MYVCTMHSMYAKYLEGMHTVVCIHDVILFIVYWCFLNDCHTMNFATVVREEISLVVMNMYHLTFIYLTFTFSDLRSYFSTLFSYLRVNQTK